MRNVSILFCILLVSAAVQTVRAGGLNALDHGVVADGETVNTEAIQNAFLLCGKTGAGAVRFPRGRYLTGPVDLPDFVEVVLEDGAELVLVPDEDGFPVPEDRALLRVRGQRGVAIRGGTLTVDDSGAGVLVEDSRQVRITGTRVSGLRGVHVSGSSRVVIEDVEVSALELPQFFISDSENVRLSKVSSPSTSNEPIIALHNCRNVILRDTEARPRNRTFVLVLGSATENIDITGNDLSAASPPYMIGPDVPPGILKADD
ncbi:MAG: hypothetical protein JJU00_00105 [Opitutales bacterium]|nr:hypothetical protein [Opitutales bacterium]